MQEQKKQKRRGAVPLQQCKGPSKQLYHSDLNILVIGDGDFSFSLSIIKWLQYSQPLQKPITLTVTSYDSREELQQMYKHTFKNTVSQLQKRQNVQIFYQVDVNKLQEYRQKLLQKHNKLFDRIIWNFPHAGFPQQQKGEHKGPGFEWEQGFHQKHINIIRNFFVKGLQYLRPDGYAIVTHKTINPFGLWNIPQIGISNGYDLYKTFDFDIDEYPGYQNRRGAGKCGGKRFPCDDAKTYVFKVEQGKQQVK